MYKFLCRNLSINSLLFGLNSLFWQSKERKNKIKFVVSNMLVLLFIAMKVWNPSLLVNGSVSNGRKAENYCSCNWNGWYKLWNANSFPWKSCRRVVTLETLGNRREFRVEKTYKTFQAKETIRSIRCIQTATCCSCFLYL